MDMQQRPVVAGRVFSAGETLRKTMQDATAISHQRLHGHPLLSPVAEGTASPATYLAALKGFYDFYAAHEGKAEKALPLSLRFAQEAAPLDWLTKDLRALGFDARTFTPSAPEAQAWDLARYVGYAYVKQGSTLGGQTIRKSLMARPELPITFFTGYGPETGLRWKAFIAWMDKMAPQIDAQKAAQAAGGFFHELETRLSAFAPA
jgi:heme oxygenase